MKTTMTRSLRKFNKINFGCGWDKREGHLNVDVDVNCAPDLLVENGNYTIIPKDHYVEIIANDVLEHISHTQTLTVLLEWSEFLKPKGKLHVQTSSILGVADQLRKQKSFEKQVGWTICLFGNQAHPGDFHHIGFTESTLKTNLLAAGYEIDSFTLEDKWLFHVDCHKVLDWTSLLDEYRSSNNEKFTEAIFEAALGREPDEMGGTHIRDGLNSGSIDRRQAIMHLFSSRERLYYIAKVHSL